MWSDLQIFLCVVKYLVLNYAIDTLVGACMMGLI